MKREKNIFSLFGPGSGSGGEEQILEIERVQLLFRFPGDRTVDSRRAKRKNCSTLQGLRVDTDFVEF